MKTQLIIQTPLGNFCAEAKELTEEEYNKSIKDLEDNISSLTYISFFQTGTRCKIIVPEGILKNSIIRIEKV